MKILIDNGHGSNTPGKRSPDGKFRERQILTGRRIRSDWSDGDIDFEDSFYLLVHTLCPEVLTEKWFHKFEGIVGIYHQQGWQGCNREVARGGDLRILQVAFLFLTLHNIESILLF